MAKRKRTLLKSKDRRELESVAAFLQQLAERLGQHELILQRDDQEIRVAVPDQVTFKLKVKEKVKRRGTRQSLQIKLKWIEGQERGGQISLG